MNELILAFVALIALLVMIWKNTFQTYPKPSRLLALALGILIIAPPLSWFAIMFCSKVLTVDSFGSASHLISQATSAVFAVALVLMIAAVFVSRNRKGTANPANS